MERSDIVANRIQFLRRIKKYREQGWTVVYTDETYVHTSHTVPKTWQSDDSSMKVPFSKGQRYIIVHAGTKAGFIQGAKLTFKAESETGDYHKEMNADNFFKWVRERLIPNLPAKSVVIIDNAPYHNIQIDKCPTTATRKADIQAWMNRHNIAFTADMFKPELLQLCRQNKPSPSYVLDNLLREHGHECLRLPPYHADLNAIELIWGIMKHFVAAHNVTFKSADVQQITQNAIDSVSPADWSGCCGHVEKVEKSYWETNIAIEDEIEKFIIEVTSSDEDTDTASECTDYSDTDTAEES